MLKCSVKPILNILKENIKNIDRPLVIHLFKTTTFGIVILITLGTRNKTENFNCTFRFRSCSKLLRFHKEFDTF